MHFTKMNGAGNDFIILDALREEILTDRLPEIARTLCDRRRSIGADGLMVVMPSQTADFRMLFFNCDGTVGEMCGNGARCICRYGYERGYAGTTQTVETTAGTVTGQRIDRRNYRIRLNTPSVLRLPEELQTETGTVLAGYAELGNPGIPHAVVEVKNLADTDAEDLFRLGRTLRYHPRFPKGANVNFVEVIGENLVLEKTYERGVEDFTLACGTGTGSAAAVLTLMGKITGRNTEFRMEGGNLYMDVGTDETGGIRDLYLTGPTNLVADGEILDEELGKEGD